MPYMDGIEAATEHADPVHFPPRSRLQRECSCAAS
jgi:hypothetical protein